MKNVWINEIGKCFILFENEEAQITMCHVLNVIAWQLWRFFFFCIVFVLNVLCFGSLSLCPCPCLLPVHMCFYQTACGTWSLPHLPIPHLIDSIVVPGQLNFERSSIVTLSLILALYFQFILFSLFFVLLFVISGHILYYIKCVHICQHEWSV